MALFGGLKGISGVFTAISQGFSSVLGKIVSVVAHVVDTVVEAVSQVLNPVLDGLSNAPLLGGTIETVDNLVGNLTGNLSDTLHSTADALSAGSVVGGVATLLNGVTDTIGATVKDAANTVDTLATDVIDPVLGKLQDAPIIGKILEGVEETLDHVVGDVDSLGDYVAEIEPLELVKDLLTDPLDTVGGVVNDVADTVDDVLNSLAPTLDVEVPVVNELGDVVQQVGAGAVGLVNGLGDALRDVDLNINLPFV